MLSTCVLHGQSWATHTQGFCHCQFWQFQQHPCQKGRKAEQWPVWALGLHKSIWLSADSCANVRLNVRNWQWASALWSHWRVFLSSFCVRDCLQDFGKFLFRQVRYLLMLDIEIFAELLQSHLRKVKCGQSLHSLLPLTSLRNFVLHWTIRFRVYLILELSSLFNWIIFFLLIKLGIFRRVSSLINSYAIVLSRCIQAVHIFV